MSKRRVLVIGGSRGIGAAIVEAFWQQGADVQFTYTGSREAADALAMRTESVAIASDASDRDALIGMVMQAGPIDVLVYSAGLFVAGDPFELEPAAIDRMIDVNVRGAYHASVAVARQMPTGGRIILIGSVNADRVPFQGLAAYSMTKSALQGAARGLARDLGSRSITVNVVQPGPTDTGMNPADGSEAAKQHDVMALKTHGTVQEVADLVLYLASPSARGITGAMHTIDGGFGA